MKKLLVVLALFMVGTVSFAQRGGGGGGGNNATPEVRAEQQTKLMTEQLGLSDAQQKQIYTLNLDRAKKMQELREAQNREGMKSLNDDFKKSLLTILTPEQAKKQEELNAETQKNAPQQGRGARGPR